MTLLFQNLIGNAVKYRRSETPRIPIASNYQNGEWVFSVADNGIGIDPKDRELIFAPFKRLHGASHTSSGLGLAMCRKIVERYHGKVWVESTSGVGSTFRFTLPVANHDATPDRTDRGQ